MSTPDPERPPALSEDEQARLLAAVTAAHELAETPLDDEAVDRVQRLLRGDLTLEDAYAELDAAYDPRLPDRPPACRTRRLPSGATGMGTLGVWSRGAGR